MSPTAFVQVSSIMPQKRNPVPIEHLRHLASMAAGRADAVIMTMHNTPFTDMNDSEGAVQEAGFAAFDDAGRVLRLMAALLPACRIRADRVAATLQAACVTVTELADHLVRAEKLSFRTAHHVAAATARAVVDAGAPLAAGYAAFADAFARETGRAPSCDADAFAGIVSPDRFVAVRDRFGGPGPAAMDEALAAYGSALATARARAEARAARHAAADTARADAFAALMLQE
jgi:argininosuccinate lyase